MTPDGRFLVFTSHGQLTRDDTSVSGATQVFRYDSQTGELTRISIGDLGFDDNGNRSTASQCTGTVCSENATIVTPEINVGGPGRLDPTMSQDGAYVFFLSPLALAPGALDDARIATDIGIPSYAQNVYEYHAGRVYLISDGKDTGLHGVESDVFLLGTSATGKDAFFSTSDQLVAQDTDTELDVYDARVCDASEPCVTPPESGVPCQDEACHGSASGAPAAPGAATVTFSGPGNLVSPPSPAAAHKKKAVKKHVKRKGSRKRPKKKKTKKAKARARRATGHGVRRSKGGRS